MKQLSLFEDIATKEPKAMKQWWMGLPCEDQWWFDLMKQGVDIEDLWKPWIDITRTKDGETILSASPAGQ